jgi:hypothetical protein
MDDHQKLLEGKSYAIRLSNTLLATLYEKSTETKGTQGGL